MLHVDIIYVDMPHVSENGNNSKIKLHLININIFQSVRGCLVQCVILSDKDVAHRLVQLLWIHTVSKFFFFFLRSLSFSSLGSKLQFFLCFPVS